MLTLSWLRGLFGHRRARMLASIAGVAICVSLVACIGSFLAGSTAAMTERSIAKVPLDWQVQARPGADARQLLANVRAFPGVRAALPVAYAPTAGASATVNGQTSTAGAGLALGIPGSYRRTYPGELRQYVGARRGVLIAQQMAANLGVTTGDVVTIRRPGLPPAKLRVDGVIDFNDPQHLLGLPATTPGATPALPPDNVVVLPLWRWHRLFDPLAARRPDLVRFQVHADLSHGSLPRDPTRAFAAVSGQAKNLESRLSGAGTVGDNLGEALDKTRGDSLYARLAFLFLGLPGALLAALVTIAIASAGAGRRRREQALVRARGGTLARLVRLALAEAAAVGLAGGALGLLTALAVGRLAFGAAGFGAGAGSAARWAAGAVLGGLLVAALAIALPAYREARAGTVSAARSTGPSERAPWWARYGLDFVALAAALLVFHATGSSGYQLVLAAEGTPQVSVDYWSFAAPLLAWLGIGLLSYRLADLALRRGRRWLARALRPLSGELSGTVAATMARQPRLIARALALVTLTGCFAASTAAFNTTYKLQAEVDARLSNGADVVAAIAPGARLAPTTAAALARIPGVASAEPVLHRYAYIGTDLQDTFGVNPATIVRNARLQDSFFSGGSAKQLFARLGRTTNGVLLSQEVVHDYQLHPGDHITMRVLDQRTRALISVPFTYVGVSNEFPTAPKDAYTVVDAGYLARATHDPGVGSFLIQTRGARADVVGRRVAAKLGAVATVSDIDSNRRLIAGSLTSVELAGLTRVELAYALVLMAAVTGLLLWLGLAERRRTFAIAQALGAKGRQLGGFVWSETAFVALGGLVLGAAGSMLLAWMLVKLLTGVFDPPPTGPSVPWGYLAGLAGVALGAVLAAGWGTLRALRSPALEELRDL